MPITRATIATLSQTSTATTPPAPSTTSQTTFVFRPGAAPEPNVYPTWSAMMNAVGQVNGPKFIQFDTQFAEAHVPAGAWNLDNVTLTSASLSGDVGTLIIDDNAQITFGILTIENCFIDSNNTKQPVVEFAAGLGGRLILSACSVETINNSDFPFIKVDASAGLCSVLAYNDVVIGDGISQTFRIDGHMTITMFGNCLLASNALSGAGSVTCSFDGTCNIGGGQTPVLTLLPLASAVRTPYTAASSPNWNNSPPANVAAALDRIAAKIGPIP